MSGAGRYDGDLQMFVDGPRGADPAHLRFLRWLVNQERIERPIADRPLEPDAEPAFVPGPDQPARRPPEWTCVPRWFGG